MTLFASRLNSLVFIAITFYSGQCALAQTAQFSADKTSGCYPVTVNFKDESSGVITSRLWNLGNGNNATSKDASATYDAPGVYTISLTVFNGAQSDTEVKTGYIVVHDFPQVDFSFNKSSGCSPLQVQFTNNVSLSAGAITSWQWIFGDGGTSSSANPAYTYDQPGTPSISLKVTTVHGCESTGVKPSAITVLGPSVQFSASATTICQIPALIQFTNQSTGAGALTHLWDFGDGQKSTEVNPSHTFTQAGTTAVKLTTTDGAGCASFVVHDIVARNEGGLDFMPSALQICRGQSLAFTVQNTDPIVSMNWNFGNGTSSTSNSPTVSYQQSGTYKITLSAQLQGRTCLSVVTKTVVVTAEANTAFSSALNCKNSLTLTNTSTGAQRVEWSVAGTIISTANTLIYNAPIGDFEITLTAFNSFGCGKPLKKTIHVPALPDALFTPDIEQHCSEPSLSGCAPFQVNFVNASTAEPSFTSSWSLGEGVTSTTKNPTRTFANAGTFPVRLVITDPRGCRDTVQRTVRVSAVAPVANFSIDKIEVCSGEVIKFDNKSTNADFLCWDFGDGATAIGDDPTHVYQIPGRYLVKLIAKNAGCSSTFSAHDSITVKEPLAKYELIKSCVDPYLVQFNDLSGNADSIHWQLSDGTTSTDRNFPHRFQAVGQYTMIFTAVNRVSKCVVPISQSILIQDVEARFTLANETPCKNNLTQATDNSIAANSWTWRIDNVPVSQATNPILSFHTAGLHTLGLVVTDSDGCLDEKQISVNVPNINGDFTIAASSDCEKLSVVFSDKSTATPPLQTWNWTFGDGGTSSDQHPTHNYLAKDTFDVTLHLTNADGNCSFTTRDAIVFTIPVAQFSTSKTNYCLNETVQFVNESLNSTKYKWNFGTGAESVFFAPTVSYPQAGTYDIKLDATDQYGCTISLTKDKFIVVAPPKADFNAFQTSGECPPLTSIFQSSSTGSALVYAWNFGNDLTSKVKDPACTYTKAGIYSVLLKVTDGFGCTDSKLVEDLIHVGGPSGKFTMDVTEACINAMTDFSATAENTMTYRYDYGDGAVVNLDQGATSHYYEAPGVFKPSLVLIDDKNCHVVAEGSREIIVHDSTAVEFSFTPNCVFNGEALFVQASNTDNEVYQWLVNGQPAGAGIENSIVIDSSGVYQVELQGTNEFGCVSSSIQEIKVHGELEFIPNVFTVNGDSYNEFFVIPGIENSDWTLQVFNRWGKEILTERNYVNNWRGSSIASGMYYYYITNQVCPERTYKGYVNVLK